MLNFGPERVSREELERIRREQAALARKQTSTDLIFKQRTTADFLKEGIGYAEIADVSFGEDISLDTSRTRSRQRLGSVNTGLVL